LGALHLDVFEQPEQQVFFSNLLGSNSNKNQRWVKGIIRMSMETDLKGMAEEMGADYFGIADLSPAHEAIVEQGGTSIGEFPRAISVGIALLHPIVDQLPRRSERAVAMNYAHHIYEVVNRRLDYIVLRLGGVLQRQKYRALAVPASQPVDDERLCGIFSHKMAAHLAGLGWIGKNCLLITPDNGPRVRWATILTDAPLKPTATSLEERCGSCDECVKICPTKALTNRNFRQEEPRDARFAAHKCKRYFNHMQETTGTIACGLCLYACPYGTSKQVE
jgi:epoxyqueuosine reductase